MGRWGVSQGPLKAIPRQGKEAGGDKIHLLVMTCHARLFGTPRVCSGVFGSSSSGVFIWIYLQLLSGKFFCFFFFLLLFAIRVGIVGDFSDLLQLWHLQLGHNFFLVSIFWHLSAYNAAKRCLFSILSSRKLY